ncbi:hypothetical protein GUJ93_ZPchr0007g3633, partial [Zizania palustris]
FALLDRSTGYRIFDTTNTPKPACRPMLPFPSGHHLRLDAASSLVCRYLRAYGQDREALH